MTRSRLVWTRPGGKEFEQAAASGKSCLIGGHSRATYWSRDLRSCIRLLLHLSYLQPDTGISCSSCKPFPEKKLFSKRNTSNFRHSLLPSESNPTFPTHPGSSNRTSVNIHAIRASAQTVSTTNESTSDSGCQSVLHSCEGTTFPGMMRTENSFQERPQPLPMPFPVIIQNNKHTVIF